MITLCCDYCVEKGCVVVSDVSEWMKLEYMTVSVTLLFVFGSGVALAVGVDIHCVVLLG